MAEEELPKCSCGTVMLRIEEGKPTRVCPHCDYADPDCGSECRRCRRLRKVVTD